MKIITLEGRRYLVWRDDGGRTQAWLKGPLGTRLEVRDHALLERLTLALELAVGRRDEVAAYLLRKAACRLLRRAMWARLGATDSTLPWQTWEALAERAMAKADALDGER